MCQLTYIDFNSKKINQLVTYSAGFINSEINKDGFGIFTPPSGIWKTKLQARLVTNLGSCLSIIGKNPVLAHSRLATFSFGGQKKIDNEFSHPFEGNKIVLAHNGSLELKEEKYKDVDIKELIDSQIFHAVLEDLYADNKTLEEALIETVGKFYGKFAFLIFDKITNKFYAVRGKSADLYYADFYLFNSDEVVGRIINTGKIPLEEIFVLASNLCQLNLNVRFDWEKTIKSIKSLDENSIYAITPTELIKYPEKIEETSKPEKAIIFGGHRPAGQYGYHWENGKWIDKTNHGNQRVKNQTKTDNPISEKLFNIMSDYRVDISYIDEIAALIFGRSILNLSHEEFELFSKFLEYTRSSAVKRVLSDFFDLMTFSKRGAIGVHLNEGQEICFPFWLERDSHKIDKILEERKKEVKNAHAM